MLDSILNLAILADVPQDIQDDILSSLTESEK